MAPSDKSRRDSTAPSRQNDAQEDEALPSESDIIVRTFGHLYEGQQAGLFSPENVARRAVLLSRWQRRLSLARLGSYPEGYEFQNVLQDGQTRNVILLTPPQQVAILRSDGSWHRHPRVQSIHGPPPYTVEWYHEYLRNCGLPSWFLSAGHIEMLSNTVEAYFLGEMLTVSRPNVDPAYQLVRYPSEPLYHYIRDGKTYKCRLSEKKQPYLARKFPATAVENKGKEVLLLPGGYVQLHHDPHSLDYPSLASNEVPWCQEGPASYVVEPQNGEVPVAPAVNPQTRDALIQEFRQQGAFVNPSSVPTGLGTWEWLEDADQERARALGYTDNNGDPSPVAVTRGRERGALALGIGRNAGPGVAFTPDLTYFNPPEQPAGRGHWEFFTTESREFAQVQFAGQADFGLGNVRDVTAEQVWRIRQQYIEDIDNPTLDADIVWIPLDATTLETEAEAAAEDQDAPPPAHVEEDLGFGIDPESGLAHWPANEPPFDQTARAGEMPHYQTRMLAGKKFTVNRAAPKADGIAREALLWSPGKGGRWVTYPNKHETDWSDKKSVSKLIPWRNQCANRANWEHKRPPPQLYTKEQKEYFGGEVEAAGGDWKNLNVNNITNAFNQRFKGKREVGAIRQQISAFVKKYKDDHGIVDEPRKKMTDAERAEARRKRRQSAKEEQDGKVPTLKKQKTTTKDSSGDALVKETLGGKSSKMTTQETGGDDLAVMEIGWEAWKKAAGKKTQEDVDAAGEETESDNDMDMDEAQDSAIEQPSYTIAAKNAEDIAAANTLAGLMRSRSGGGRGWRKGC